MYLNSSHNIVNENTLERLNEKQKKKPKKKPDREDIKDAFEIAEEIVEDQPQLKDHITISLAIVIKFKGTLHSSG